MAEAIKLRCGVLLVEVNHVSDFLEDKGNVSSKVAGVIANG